MRIVITVTNDLSYDRRMQRIAGVLSRQGHQVLMLGRHLPDSPRLYPRPWAERRMRCFFRRGPLFYLEYNARLLALLLGEPFDALYTVDLDTMPGGLAAAWLRRKRRVFDAHEYFTETPEVTGRPVVKAIWGAVARLGIPLYHSAITVGPALARIFEEKYGRPFTVVRNMPLALPRPPARPHPGALLYQGALNEGRGLETMIAAMAYLPDCTLTLVGEGDLSDSLRRMAAAHPAAARIRFVGCATPDRLADWTAQAWLGLNLLEHRGESYYYSLANKFFDFVQAGTPVLTMNFPEYAALNRQHEVAILLDRLDPEAVSQAIRGLLDDPQRYARLCAACEVARREWVWEREAEALYGIFPADS
ncbi:MAG: glycosyltransferase [Saprospiraceae bacterium]